MKTGDIEDRLRALEGTVLRMGRVVIDQAEEIERLKAELQDARLDASVDAKLAALGVLA